MKLLLEVNENIKVLKEGTGDKKSYFIEGVFLQGNLKNKNGRVYPTEVLAKECQNYTKNFIEKRRAFGELNHPDSPNINLDRVSHLITELKQNGDNFIGKAKIIDTPCGKIIKNLMDENCLLGVSSRGLGSLKEDNGGHIVQDDFTLATAADIVSDPSAPQAFVENLMEGNAEWISVGGKWVPKFREKMIKKLSNKGVSIRAEALAKDLFEEFIKRVR